MTTYHHTAVAAGAAATAATVNSPLGQIDAKLTHALQEYNDDAGVNTTVVTNGTYYAVTGYEVSFTPAYTGQTFLVGLSIGWLYANTAGVTTAVLRLVDSVNATITDNYLMCRTQAATTSSQADTVGGTRVFTAAAGDVGVVRKVKLYTTHTVNGTIVTARYGRILVVTH